MKQTKNTTSKNAKKNAGAKGRVGLTSALYKSQARSRITNGRTLLPSIDGRCLWARRFRDLISLHLNDLGGEDACSESEKALVRRASCLIVELEHAENGFALAGSATADQLKVYQMTTNTLRRLLETLGLRRRPKDITPPTLADYIAANSKNEAEEAEVVE